MMKLNGWIRSLFLCLGCQLAANPSVHVVKQGEVTVCSQGNETWIVQSSDRAVIHWQDFSIRAGEIAHFMQPSKDAAILNRVIGALPSTIDGSLLASGKVYLINPQGVLIGPHGKIQTNGFVATTLEIADEAFLANQAMGIGGASEARIINLGLIEALEGDVVLIAREVENTGIIQAKNGTAALAGASEVLLSPQGGQKIFIKPQAVGRIDNGGSIEAVQAEIRAAGGSAYSLAINQTGIIEAAGTGEQEGRIVIQAEKNNTTVSGTLVAQRGDQTGGTVHVLGESVDLIDHCTIDVSGKSGGGTICIGGDPNHFPPIPLATTTYVGPDVLLKASVDDIGDGGKVVAWGKEAQYFYGTVEAQGGKIGGNGGFVEVSCLKTFDYHGLVNTLAPHGKIGILLLDPSDITISAAASSPAFPTAPGVYDPPGASGTLNNGDLQTGLGTTNILVTTAGGAGGTGNITWSAGASIAWAAATTLTLTANRAMSLGSNITNTGIGSFTAMDFTANSGGASAGTFNGITVAGGVTIASTQGAIIFNGRGGNTSTSNIGVQINAGAIIQSTGAGASAATISITGHGGTINSANNYGVEITGALAKITSVDGAISVTGIGHATSGTGNSFNHGIYIHVGGSITSTGIATIALNGTGAAAQTTNTGVTIDGANSLITSVTGAINITGVGGAGTSNNSGVVISGSAKVTSTGAAALAAPITINGTGGGGTGSNNGILIDETGSRVTTADGSITLTGSSNGTTTACHGISMNANGGVTYGGVTAGTITLTGTGSGSTGNGVNINTSAGITADTVSPKNIVLTGTPSDLAEDGIRLSDPLGNANTTGNLTLEADTMNLASGTIQTTGAILIEQKTVATSIGLAGGAGTLNIIAAELDTIQAGASSLTIGRSDGASTMTVNAYTFNNPVTLVDSVINTGGAVSTGAGMSITLTADTMAIGAALSGTGTLKIQPLTASTSIGLADGAVGTLNLTTAELNFLGASFTSITFGAALGTGTVDMRAYSTYATPLIVYGGTISVNGALVNSGNQSVTFYIGPAAAGVLNLSATVTTSGSFQINGGGFNDNYNIITTSAQTATLSGNGGTNTIAGPSTTNTWTITADNAGTLNTNIAFSNVQILTGNDAGDNFTFNGAFAVSAINGGAGTDSITGPNVVNAWTITADNAGALTPTGASGPTTFSNIGALIGGSVADTFTFTGAFRLNGATGINGGTGTNSLTGTDVNTAWSITGDNAGTMTPTGASGATTFSNVGALVCGTANDAVTFTGAYRLNGATGVSGNAGTNTITGPDIATAWSITADNGGSLNPTGSSGATTFSSFSTLTGGTAADSFTFAGAFQISGSINGGTGSNSLTGPNVVNAWSITADNAGTLTPTGASGATTFTNIGALVGGSVADTFTFTGAFRLDGATGIDGGAGANSLTAPNVVNAWSITGDNAGSLTPTGSSGATTFANVGSLIGGNAADSFTFTGAYRLNGATGIDGGAGSNSLTGPNVVNTWSITADNTGTLTPTGASGATTFANIAALTGGSAADSFTFTGAFQLNGATGITGGTGTDTVTGPNLVNAWSISGANAGSLNPAGASGATTFANIDNLAGGSTDDTLTGPAGGNTWAINALNGGSLTTSGISFTGMEKIVGGAGNDDFAFTAAGIITGIAGIGIEGGGGSNSVAGPSGAGVIAWSVTGAAAGSIDPGAGATTFISIQLLAGNSTHDTLTGPAGGDTWTINAADGGSLTASGISFTGIESLVGGAGNDNFTFTTAGKLSGDGGIGIDGGAGTNTITGPGGAAAAAWSVTGATTGLINAGAGITTFTSIQQLSGNSTNDTLTGPDSGDTWTINASNGGSLASGISFTGMEKFVGGAGDDNYTFTIAGVITGIGGMGIDGGGGSNVVTGPGGAGLVDWSATGPSIGAINPGAGATTFTSIEQLTGMSTNDILTGPAAGDNWTINASNGGYLAVFNFSGMEKLVGGAGNDLFTFTTFGVITG
ncbi:MAG: hypothetical protein HW387_1529, partial [Parachlamydiales bacterium]|nr:hypothetical protein [Parachlamydiales bacterium]